MKYPYKNKEWLIKAIKEHKTVVNIVREEKVPDTCIRRYVKRFGLEGIIKKPVRKGVYTINQNYFESIDSERKAY